MSDSKEGVVLNLEDVDAVLDGLALLMSKVCGDLNESIDIHERHKALGMFACDHFQLIDEIKDIAERLEGMKRHPLTFHFHDSTPSEVGYSCEDGHYNT